MTQIKESSTRNFNKALSSASCPVTFVMNKIGGHWKPIILFHLMSGPKRYSELKRAIPAITEKMLIQHLKQLQEDDLVIRIAAPVVPPFVTYHLSRSGIKLGPVLDAMATWGKQKAKKRKQKIKKPFAVANGLPGCIGQADHLFELSVNILLPKVPTTYL